jgi:hypothetical protein
MKSNAKLIVWLWLLLSTLTLTRCTSSKPSSYELQQRDITIASNAQRITDAEAAAVCYDMLTSCEKRLADSTAALRATRQEIPKKVREGKLKGAGMGAGGLALLWILIKIL